ncbi:cytochrome P450 [Solwaraspora sp. WMMA2056]|uniref:cytochrome P450 n=1 Tax=Solwaraspora sp. WMMA2056 TaxID=3015161 RepID=UPI00259BDBC9|nr:cytochrome P450 [Solwaraspora sp. WMMA2056]WJK38220.1 cytochrome P450 [Solwaraspora sp. WMMA2056]
MTTTAAADSFGPLPALVDLTDPAPVVRVSTPTGDQVWVVTDLRLGRAVLGDARFSRAAAAAAGAPRVNTANPAPSSMMSMDGAAHARLRRQVSAAFGPRRVDADAVRVRRLTDELLDAMIAAGPPADLMAAVAVPLPVAVIGDLLGVPAADRPQVQQWAGVLFDVTATGARDKARRAFTLYAYMSRLIDKRRAQPGDDLLTGLITAHDAGALTRTELVDLALAVLTAGYETTVGQFGLGVLAHLLDPAALGTAPDETRVAAVVEEHLRRLPATPMTFPRVALADVALGPVTVRAGEAVVVSILHANRDTAGDGPPAGTGARAHLTFGHGAHYCLGAALARTQLRIALHRLLHRVPGLRLADGPDPVRWWTGLATRGPAQLLVTW